MLGSEIEVLNGALIEEASQERTCRVLDLFATVAPDFDDCHHGGPECEREPSLHLRPIEDVRRLNRILLALVDIIRSRHCQGAVPQLLTRRPPSPPSVASRSFELGHGMAQPSRDHSKSVAGLMGDADLPMSM